MSGSIYKAQNFNKFIFISYNAISNIALVMGFSGLDNFKGEYLVKVPLSQADCDCPHCSEAVLRYFELCCNERLWQSCQTLLLIHIRKEYGVLTLLHIMRWCVSELYIQDYFSRTSYIYVQVDGIECYNYTDRPCKVRLTTSTFT